MTIRQFSLTIAAATIQNLRTTSVTQTTIALAWDVYPGATGYEIRRNGTLVQTWNSGTQTTYSNSGHTAGTSYTYAVRPVVGGSGVASAQASIVVVTQSAAQQFAGLTPTVTVATVSALQSALASATAGTIIGVEPGVYSSTLTQAATRQIPIFNTAASGTAGNPIRIVARYPAAMYPGSSAQWTELRNGQASGNWYPTFGSYLRNYIEWIGFYVNEASSPPAVDTGPVVLWSATGCAIRLCRIIGGAPFPTGERHSGISVNGGAAPVLSQNYIDGFWSGSIGTSNANASAIMLDGCGGGTVERNELVYSGGGIFHKRADESGGGGFNPGNWVVRYNYLRNTMQGIRFDSNHYVGQTSYTADIYQNLLVGVETALGWGNSSNDAVGKIRFQNNTVVNGSGTHDGAFVFVNVHPTSGMGIAYWNNVVSNVEHAVVKYVTGTTWDTTALDSQHNVFHGITGAFWYQDGPTYTVSTWNANGMDTEVPAAITSDPLFAGGAGAAAYKLQSGSPALTLGRDLLGIAGAVGGTIPAGCYITGNETIGPGY